ncbi:MULTISPECIES: hypothetical protein [unclassified Paenibacillus]|uniref:hypothetical protein n=1 Tax=unclassified Paenibacillus TaxID=185978 RepID=UPI0009A8BE23|nr:MULTISPECIES: hypothetical protein [unclassified Paenibacillus]SLK21730.1 hypothetical protein SAMN06272722_11970 [Paenibacillus sp. RU5A]SOC76720.1 hypothetical protein SAMN05880581_11970 [Paenibacillus sp. RU26A]SOC78111.1 hypothetical protein SAMN05880586_11970 [Paenibacillus sp. RU5M]
MLVELCSDRKEVSRIRAYKTKEEFQENCDCAYAVYNLVDSINDSDVTWFFDVCFYFPNQKLYTISFVSYETPEYKDYKLGISAIQNESGFYDLKITQRVDNLLGGAAKMLSSQSDQ